jgi:hypothetical protein
VPTPTLPEASIRILSVTVVLFVFVVENVNIVGCEAPVHAPPESAST